jgi:hypothetical protein
VGWRARPRGHRSGRSGTGRLVVAVAALAAVAGCTVAPAPPLVTTPAARTTLVQPTDTAQIVVGVDGIGGGYNPHELADQSSVTTALANLLLGTHRGSHWCTTAGRAARAVRRLGRRADRSTDARAPRRGMADRMRPTRPARTRAARRRTAATERHASARHLLAHRLALHLPLPKMLTHERAPCNRGFPGGNLCALYMPIVAVVD